MFIKIITFLDLHYYNVTVTNLIICITISMCTCFRFDRLLRVMAIHDCQI